MLSILLEISVFLISSLGFLFLIWRRLKEDYTRNQIFTLALSSLLGLYTGAAIGILIPKSGNSQIFNLRGIWFWFSLISGTGITMFCVYKFKMRFYETAESFVAGLIFMGFMWSLVLLPFAVVIFVILGVIFFVVDKKYKEFGWYKSGKMGLAGLISMAVFFIIRAIVAIASPNMISFIGRVDALVSAIIAFLLFLSIYNLSEKI